ncbi:hypothetical protein C4885_10215 [Subdoligranulum sp. APC924/74]|uniref:SpaA isopeptide-forming pilin-related protein n=1 Tax=Subdoligranulum sp. APC924/74 TaxID=2086273 RepID=UPI000DEAEFBF|nr:SpaA isopeptide-forming pilin-related protein [Subdoligranulum sp. APC924/74]RCH49962.1 hypothetical protein C4885_10215 [Subdoligranulum sp. APC924/74]
MNRTGKNTTGWARRLTALLVTACLVMAMALPVYAEVDLLPDAPDEVELLEDEQGTASGEDTTPPEQNAATPEPEQSAEPEQPAPTETPEPTAEPALTPEPAATATATPVPTVTPTATPEPTEQPQKMYAAESVDNVQAASEQEAAEGFTVYFVVPDTMPGNNETVTVLDSDEIKFNVRTDRKPGNSKNDEWWLQLSMEPTGWKTEDGHKIYAVKNCKDILGDNFLEIQFQLYRDGGWTAQITLKEQEPKPINFYNNKMYDPTKNADPTKGEWTDDSILTSHTYYANKPIKFENRSTANLRNVKANFYIPDEKSGNLTLVNGDAAAQNVPEGEFVSFTIPEQACSYVQFTWDEDGEEKSSKFYNFYNESVSGNDKESFMYSETSNCFIYTGADNVRWGRENSFRIYYDATFSKLPTTGTGDTSGNYSIPKANNSETIYYRIKGGNGNSEKGTLVKDDTNENLYYVDIPQEYSSNSSIIFSGEEINDDNATKGNGVSTEWLEIPTDGKNCFYADTNDDAVYKGTTRGGYWAPKGTLRDAEKGKDTGTKVVDIKSAPFTEEANTKYVTSTLYDYYTDYELNGNNRGSYDQSSPTVSHRNWVPFRQFDQALSDYYKDAKAEYPIYTGHFQPGGGTNFSDIATTLNLFGYDKFKRFMAINNSQYNEDPQNNDNNHTYYAYQGLVKDTTSTGKATGEPLLKGTGAVEPHFNKEFLLGKNSKNAKLGEVYDNVAFPFTKKQIFGEDQGVDYWCFDSKDTTLYLKQNSEQNSDSKYFLQSQSANNRESSKNVSASSTPKDPYGYFPFNETAKPGVFSTYNYGFGTKLQMDFTLTDDGMVETEKADGTTEKTSIKFFFSGDDDVWVFIDGQLALDVGGAHGEVSGLLEFGETDTEDGKKNSVTAYVSKVKTGGTSGSDKDDKNGNSPVKTVTYNKEVIKFYAQGTTLPLDKGQKHTLTMYYMERGMWESNMAVAFNFPDNNELQVQKEVELSKVDPDFKNCFKDQKIFNFTIQNQATHYGKTDAVGPNESGTQSQKVNLNESNIAAATPGNEYDYIFRRETNPWPDSGNENEQVLHWYARFTDTQSAAREKRRGILTLENPINIKDMRFLTFQVYVDPKDHGGDLSLNNLYLELLDENNVQKGSLGTTGINGATYGSVEVKTGAWVTVKLDLHKMKEQGGFNNNVKTIRVGDNYNRNIYFRDFTFIPKAVPSKMTGFTTDQKDIPDYGSAESGNLENAENAQYTSTEDTDTQLVDEDGRFVLEDGETVTFSDQFRRGSYISLKEELNQSLYDTTWTVYENGQKVTSMMGGDSVSLPSPTPSLIEQKGSSPNDGRTEKTGAEEQNKYDGNKPSADTIVFRSYKDPDENSSTLTKLKVKYVNTVKTGGLKIQKKAAEGEEGTINGTYTFKVTFNDVGGEGLEKKDIIKYVEINMSDGNNPEHTVTITGIPVGTRYTIEEVKTDDSRLQSVTVPPDCHSAHEINNNTMVEGVIEKSEDPNNPELTAIFTNTKRKLINIEFDKLWKDANDTVLGTTNQPNEIYIQLQRRLATSTNDKDWTLVKYPANSTQDYVTIKRNDYGWQFTFSNLDQYPVDDTNTNYQYRIVEGKVDDKGKFTQADGTITIKGNTYVVKAEATANSEKDSETGATTTPATVTPDGTITGGSGKIVLTNTLQNPKFALDIIKKDAEPNNEGQEVFLKGVEFKLEKLVETTTEGKTQSVVDKNYPFDNTNKGSITGTTGADGKITPNPFTNLEPGTYRLTETKAHPGYNLLAQPIVIEFTQGGKCSIDGQLIDDKNKFTQSGNIYTMHLTVLNRKTPELPHTGADAPSLWLLIGMPLAVAGLLIFTFRYNRKGGRRH